MRGGRIIAKFNGSEKFSYRDTDVENIFKSATNFRKASFKGISRSLTASQKKKGITYTGSGSKGTTFRIHSENSLFDVGGSCVFPTGAFGNLEYIIAFMNSRLAFYLIDCLNPTVNTQVGDLKRVPFVKPSKEIESKVSDLATKCIELKKKIDSNYILNGSISSPLAIESKL